MHYSKEDILKKIAEVPFWWHTVEVTEGMYTPGQKSLELMQNEFKLMNIPDLNGKTVLDIGAWDGGFAFEAERLGAKNILALDHYIWSMDIPRVMVYLEECKAKNITPKQYDQIPEIWHPDTLPGKRGIDTLKELKGSRVETRVADFMDMDLGTLGTFDVIFYLGVLYHMHNPFEGLKRLASITKEFALIETSAVLINGYEDHGLCEFYPFDELGGDVNNWWSPNKKALIDLCLAAGFHHVEFLSPLPIPTADQTGPIHYRATVKAWK